MKLTLLIITISAIGFALQLKLHTIPNRDSQISSLKEEKGELNKTLSLFKSENGSLTKQIQEITETNSQLKEKLKEREKELAPVIVQAAPTPEPEPVKEDYSVQNGKILSEIASLTEQKRLEKQKAESNLSQIEGFILKGKTLLSEHLKIKPEFKEGKVRTSDVDRKKWEEQHEIRENFLKTEISKLEGRKENINRTLSSFEAKIDMEIQKLQNQIK